MVAQRIVTTKEKVEAQKTAPLPPMVKLAQVDTLSATSSEDQLININKNLRLGLPMLNNLPQFGKIKNKPIALVGGGPSLKNHLDDVRKFKTIIACGSVNDYLMSNGIIPTYAANCDPDPVCAKYFTKTDSETIYLFAASSAPELIKAVEGKPLVLWHCHSEEQHPGVLKIQEELGIKDYYGVGGGCTVGLRSICIAMALGYVEMHFFGFDSCMAADDENVHHAYEFATEEENNLIEKIYRIQLGDDEGPSGKTYYVAGYQLAQGENFKNFFCNYSDHFKPVFHGEGLLKDLHHMMLQSDDRFTKAKEQTNV